MRQRALPARSRLRPIVSRVRARRAAVDAHAGGGGRRQHVLACTAVGQCVIVALLVVTAALLGVAVFVESFSFVFGYVGSVGRSGGA